MRPRSKLDFLWGLLGVGALAIVAWLHPPASLSFAGVALLLVVIPLEQNSVNLPWGIWRAAPALTLGAVLRPSLGGWTASALSLLGAMALPTHWTKKVVSWAQLQILVAAALALPPEYAPIAAGALLYAVGRWLSSTPSDTRNIRLRYSILPFELGLAALVPVLANAGSDYWIVLAAPVLWACQQGVSNARHRIFADQAAAALDELEESQVELAHTRTELKEQSQVVSQLHRRQQLLEGFAQHLAQGPELPATLRTVLETVQQILPCRTVAVFLWNEGLLPTAYHSPEGQDLAAIPLTGLKVPLVERAYASGKAICWNEGCHSEALLRSEIFAVVCPLDRLGVLYVGREANPISPEEAQMVSWIADKAALAISFAAQQEKAKRLMAEHSHQNYALRERVELLGNLVEGSRWLGSHLSRELLFEALQSELECTLRHDAGCLFGLCEGRLQVDRRWKPGSPWPGANVPQSWYAVAEAVVAANSPLLLPDLLASRFGGLGHEGRCLIGAPLLIDDQVLGVLLVVTFEPNRFTREHLDVLTLIGLQLAVSLANAQLYGEVLEAQRRLEVSQAQLIQSSKLNAIGQLAAGVAHELNTPLGAISLSLEMLELQGASGKSLQSAQNAVDKAQKIVHKLLVYARKETETDNVRVNLQETVTGACELVMSRFKQRGVHLEWEGTEELARLEVLARSVELQQVLVNLLINGADAYPPGAPDETRRVRLDLGLTRQNEPYIDVRDWAGGIPMEIQPRVFEPFYTTKPVGEGTGLGLSISKEILERFKAELSFQSSSHGTIFQIVFPAIV